MCRGHGDVTVCPRRRAWSGISGNPKTLRNGRMNGPLPQPPGRPQTPLASLHGHVPREMRRCCSHAPSLHPLSLPAGHPQPAAAAAPQPQDWLSQLKSRPQEGPRGVRERFWGDKCPLGRGAPLCGLAQAPPPGPRLLLPSRPCCSWNSTVSSSVCFQTLWILISASPASGHSGLLWVMDRAHPTRTRLPQAGLRPGLPMAAGAGGGMWRPLPVLPEAAWGPTRRLGGETLSGPREKAPRRGTACHGPARAWCCSGVLEPEGTRGVASRRVPTSKVVTVCELRALSPAGVVVCPPGSRAVTPPCSGHARHAPSLCLLLCKGLSKRPQKFNLNSYIQTAAGQTASTPTRVPGDTRRLRKPRPPPSPRTEAALLEAPGVSKERRAPP